MNTLTLKRFFIGLAGATVILTGVALLVLPGPGWLIIFAGMGILATEFAFARRLMTRTRYAACRTARAAGVSNHWRRKLHLHRSRRSVQPPQA